MGSKCMHSGFLTKTNLVTDTSDKNSFFGPPAVTGRVLSIKVCLVCVSVLPSVLPSVHKLIGSLVFSET